MTRMQTLFALTIVAVPLLVHAQTANTPGGSASTGTPLDQTKTSAQKSAPGTTATSPSTTNPAGTVTPKHSDGKKGRAAPGKNDDAAPSEAAPGGGDAKGETPAK